MFPTWVLPCTDDHYSDFSLRLNMGRLGNYCYCYMFSLVCLSVIFDILTTWSMGYRRGRFLLHSHLVSSIYSWCMCLFFQTTVKLARQVDRRPHKSASTNGVQNQIYLPWTVIEIGIKGKGLLHPQNKNRKYPFM